jgi:hypothetical protein
MITVSFSGNIGNSLVQHLITRIVADKNGYEFGFNPTFHYDYHNGYNQLDFFSLNYGNTHSYGYHEIPPGIEYVWEEKKEVFNYPNGDSVNFYDYQPDIFDVKNNTKLVISRV